MADCGVCKRNESADWDKVAEHYRLIVGDLETVALSRISKRPIVKSLLIEVAGATACGIGHTIEASMSRRGVTDDARPIVRAIVKQRIEQALIDLIDECEATQ